MGSANCVLSALGTEMKQTMDNPSRLVNQAATDMYGTMSIDEMQEVAARKLGA